MGAVVQNICKTVMFVYFIFDEKSWQKSPSSQFFQSYNFFLLRNLNTNWKNLFLLCSFRLLKEEMIENFTQYLYWDSFFGRGCSVLKCPCNSLVNFLTFYNVSQKPIIISTRSKYIGRRLSEVFRTPGNEYLLCDGRYYKHFRPPSAVG